MPYLMALSELLTTCQCPCSFTLYPISQSKKVSDVPCLPLPCLLASFSVLPQAPPTGDIARVQFSAASHTEALCWSSLGSFKSVPQNDQEFFSIVHSLALNKNL